jgi:hypothetical protein
VNNTNRIVKNGSTQGYMQVSMAPKKQEDAGKVTI